MKLKKLILNYFPVIFGLALVLHNTIPTPSLAQSEAKFQLVESIPLETSLASDKTARTLEIWLEMFGSAQDLRRGELTNRNYLLGGDIAIAIPVKHNRLCIMRKLYTNTSIFMDSCQKIAGMTGNFVVIPEVCCRESNSVHKFGILSPHILYSTQLLKRQI